MKKALFGVLLLAASVGIGACSPKTVSSTETVPEALIEASVSTEQEVSVEDPVISEEDTEVGKEATGEQNEAEEVHTLPYDLVTLDGVKDHHFLSTDYCYIESEKYYVLIDKDIDLPGDFVTNVDAIVDEIERLLGLPACTEDFWQTIIPDMSVYYDGKNPWGQFYVGNKIPIFIMVDREDQAWIPCATDGFTVIVSYELFSDELWNSIPSYRDNAWRRNDYVDYTSIAHELTHTIALRDWCLTDIMNEGIAEYMERAVIDNLAKDYESIAEVKEKRYLYDESIPGKVNAENAERIFVEDYHNLETIDRGAQYTFGRYLWQFLFEQNGADFYSKYSHKMKTLKPNYNSYYYDSESIQPYVTVLKEMCGEDVFTRFGEWCVKKNAMQ